MIIPLLITGGILGVTYAFGRVAPAPAPLPQGPLQDVPSAVPMPDVSAMTPTMAVEGRTIRIDPDFPSETLAASVGDTISMHGVSRRSEFNPEGYVVNAPPNLVRQTGPNDFLLLAPGQFTITWAPNYRVTVEVR